MKHVAAAILAMALLISMPATVFAADDDISVSAQSAVLMDADSGQLLWEKDPDTRRLIASTTKIMTALVALERCDLDEIVTIDAAWTGIEGSSMYLRPGLVLSIRYLLYGLMLASGNDAAVAVANIAAGSIEDFAALMNDKAVQLGCENTHFMNPNGLDDPDHYSSARDLAIIAREAIGNEDFRRIVSTVSKTVGNQTYVNHNRLLREYPGVFGVKTGYTEAAGRTLVTCCERGGVTLICVTLSDGHDWADHKALYDWAWTRYIAQNVVDGNAWSLPVIGGTAQAVTVTPQADLTVTRCEMDDVRVRYLLPSFVYAPVAAGETAGEAIALKNGIEVGRVALVYTTDIAQTEERTPTLWERLRTMAARAEGNIFKLS